MDRACIAAMHGRQGSSDSIRVRRRQNQMHMIWHQHTRPDFDIACTARCRQKFAVQRIIGILEKSLRPPVATLRDVMGRTGEYQASEAAHMEIIACRSGGVN
jgi:hypothetical protein